MKSISSFIFAFIFFIALLGGVWWVATHYAEERVSYVENAQQKRLDSLSVVAQNRRVAREEISDSLAKLDKKFKEYVTQSKQEIASYSTIIGSLRVEKDRASDSVRALNRKISLHSFLNQDSSVTNTFRDTLISRTETWSDSLFATTATAQFHSDSLLLESHVEWLRDIRIDVVNTVSADNRQVNTFVRSPDFDSLQVRAVTEIHPERSAAEKWRDRLGWLVTALLVIRETINLLN